MKRYLIFTTVLLLLLCSCGDKNAVNFSDYFHVAACDGILCKLNVLDGTLTPLCNDPLCDHTYESGCPLCGYAMGCVWDGTLYFTARSSTPTVVDELRAYDFDTSAVRLVCRLPEHPTNGWIIVDPKNGTWLDAPAVLDGKTCDFVRSVR